MWMQRASKEEESNQSEEEIDPKIKQLFSPS
jgi:hypothetical protein